MANILPQVSLDAAGLVSLAEISATARRTDLLGNSIIPDMFVLCPGMHRQQSAPELSGGEFPAVAAMTTGYIFRVENPATVLFLQSIARTGHLTTLHVSPLSDAQETSKNENPTKGSPSLSWGGRLRRFLSPHPLSLRPDFIAQVSYASIIFGTLCTVAVFFWLRDWWGGFCILVLVVSRLLNVIVIRRRCRDMGWKGVPEPGVQGDLLVLLSGDRWARIKGAATDLKAVTAGQWMRDRTVMEDLLSALATLLVYISTVLVCNISKLGQLLLMVLLVITAGLLFTANATTTVMHMNGRIMRTVGARKKYTRRRDMADELVRETKRADWARHLGMIVDVPSDAADLPDTKEDSVVL